MKQDLAAEALREIADLWRVDRARMFETDDGFDWWPGDYRVSVSATRRTDGYVPETWMLSVRTDFLRDIPIENQKFVDMVAALASLYGGIYAPVFPPLEIWDQHGTPGSRPQLWLANSAYLTAENARWLPRFLANMSIMQPIDARIAHRMPEALDGGTPNVSNPRGLGPKAQTDVLQYEKARYIWHGNQPNRWIGTGEFEKIARNWNGFHGCVCDVKDERLRLDPGPGNEAPLIFLSTDEKHSELGNGLLGELILPAFGGRSSIATMSAGRNLAESMWTDIPQFGSWYPRTQQGDQVCPAFALFIPNALYGPGIAALALRWLYQRYRLVFYGEHPTPG